MLSFKHGVTHRDDIEQVRSAESQYWTFPRDSAFAAAKVEHGTDDIQVQKSRLRCDMYANKRSSFLPSFQAKHNPSPLSVRPRPSFSGLNKKLFSSPLLFPLPFHSVQQTMFFSTHLARGARASTFRIKCRSRD